MLERSLNPNDVINLLSKLKARTPDYPPDLLAARKAVFLKQVVTISIDSSGKGGGDGGSLSSGSGGSGALGGMSTAQAILLQSVIGVWIIAAMLTASYFFRDEIINLLQDYGIVTVEVTQVPSLDSPAPAINPAVEAPSPDIRPTDTPSPLEAVAPEDSASNESSSDESSSDAQDSSENTEDDKDDQGLHLGQTPGAPDTPNQNNQDKPDKPENPNKPDKNK
jgi:hypothetical protein